MPQQNFYRRHVVVFHLLPPLLVEQAQRDLGLHGLSVEAVCACA
jgi:hypothetical protein